MELLPIAMLCKGAEVDGLETEETNAIDGSGGREVEEDAEEGGVRRSLDREETREIGLTNASSTGALPTLSLALIVTTLLLLDAPLPIFQGMGICNCEGRKGR